MLRYYALLLLASSVIGCRSRDPYAMETAALAVRWPVSDTTAIEPPEDGSVSTTFFDGRARALIHKESNRTVYLTFDCEKGKLLRGRLSSKDPDANLRISQIILPDGSMDGPFGWDIAYDLPETGTYRLAIHENMMAGTPWEGDFRVELIVK